MSGREVGAAWGPPLDVSALSWGPEPLSIGVDPHPRHPMVGLTGAGAGEGEGPQPHGGRGCTRGASGILEWEMSTAGSGHLCSFSLLFPRPRGSPVRCSGLYFSTPTWKDCTVTPCFWLRGTTFGSYQKRYK